MKTIKQIKQLVEIFSTNSDSTSNNSLLTSVRDNYIPLFQFNIEAFSSEKAQLVFGKIGENVSRRTSVPYLPDGLHTKDQIGMKTFETPTIMEWLTVSIVKSTNSPFSDEPTGITIALPIVSNPFDNILS
jgi:hypothetical protein